MQDHNGFVNPEPKTMSQAIQFGFDPSGSKLSQTLNLLNPKEFLSCGHLRAVLLLENISDQAVRTRLALGLLSGYFGV